MKNLFNSGVFSRNNFSTISDRTFMELLIQNNLEMEFKLTRKVIYLK